MPNPNVRPTSDLLRVAVDTSSIVPISEQLRAQIAYLIRSSALGHATRLPTVRDLAADLGIAVNTVNKAYAELEREGLTESRRRAGTIVTFQSEKSDRYPETLRAASHLVTCAKKEGVDTDTLLMFVKRAKDEAESVRKNRTKPRQKVG